MSLLLIINVLTLLMAVVLVSSLA